jgi:hypothetical protein
MVFHIFQLRSLGISQTKGKTQETTGKGTLFAELFSAGDGS